MRVPRQTVVLLLLTGLFLSARGAFAAEAAPSVAAAIDQGVAFLQEKIPDRASSGEAVLGALALVKAGTPPDDPAVQAVLREIEKRCAGEAYKPHSHHYYVAGLEIMLMESVDPQRYYEEIGKILAYILKGQLDSGAWFYPNQNGTGDTSITQYSALGMWSAQRAGHEVPASVWDGMAAWHIKTQHKNGGFSYHPGQGDDKPINGALTFGGGANLLLARLHLYGDMAESKKSKPDSPSQETRFGVLEAVDLDEPQGEEAKAKQASEDAQVPVARITQSVAQARNWCAVNFRLPPPVQFKMYYLYALERMMALGNFEMLGPHNWYAQGAQLLVKTQTPEGTWTLDGGDPIASAAFGVMFLTRSTGKMLGRAQAVPGLGGGVLAGGRGLPSDLDKVSVSGGDVEEKGDAGPIDELLARLETAQVGDVPETQQAILDSVRFGDREKLLQERDRIRRLVSHPSLEVRRTAFWVLGRAGDLNDVPRLIEGLSDPEIDVAIEAHNALCVLSRRPLGFDVPADPLATLGENGDDEAREQAIANWRERAIQVWSDWYAKVAPYEQRGGLGLFRN